MVYQVNRRATTRNSELAKNAGDLVWWSNHLFGLCINPCVPVELANFTLLAVCFVSPGPTSPNFGQEAQQVSNPCVVSWRRSPRPRSRTPAARVQKDPLGFVSGATLDWILVSDFLSHDEGCLEDCSIRVDDFVLRADTSHSDSLVQQRYSTSFGGPPVWVHKL